MIESFLGILRVSSKFMIGLSFCLLMYPAALPFWGQTLDIKPAYALIFSLLSLSYAKLGESAIMARFMIVFSTFISQAVVLAVLLLLLVAYTTWLAFGTIQPLDFSMNQIVLVISALMTAVSTIVGCIAVYGTVIPWYQFYLNDQTYE